MTSDAIPQQADVPREITRHYFDGGLAFGVPHARPAIADRVWDDDQLLEAAHAGAAGRDLYPGILIALCKRFVDLVQDETVRAQQLVASQGVGSALLTQLCRVSAENVHLRHQISGTTPACVQAALEAEMSAETLQFHADAVVVDVPLPPTGGRP